MHPEIRPFDPGSPEAGACLAQYYAELASRFEAGFDPAAGAAPDPATLRPPLGLFLIALLQGQPAGCVALAGDGSATAEVRRLWIAPAARGTGLAHRLMTTLEDHARSIGVTTLRLDTNRALTEAVRFYSTRGWAAIPRYTTNPYAHHRFAKTL